MSQELLTQFITALSGVMLLAAVLQVWRRSLMASVAWLAIQGAALAGIVLVMGIASHERELVAVSGLVLVLKAVVMPWALIRTARMTTVDREVAPLINPTAGLLWASLLATIAYLVSRPITAAHSAVTLRAVPVGIALVLIGFLVLMTRRQALSQLIGFVMMDNGIATVAFLTSGGVPLVVELGVSLDVLLVVLIMGVLTNRMMAILGATDLVDLRKLRD